MATVLLLTDLVDSTVTAQRLGDVEAAALWQRHDHLARALLRDWHGQEIDKSDGFLLLFNTVADAVGWALAYQRALGAMDPPLAARCGIHQGPLTLRETPAEDVAHGAKPVEVDGLAKPVAARIMALALGGQVLLSAEARAVLADDTCSAAGWRVLSHGHWRLKGVDEPAELFEVGEDGFAPFAPPPDAPKAWRVVWRDQAWLPVAELRHNLPAERDSFVGRASALQDLARCFDDGARLVCLLGIGGVGKTRLALRHARGWLGNYPGGAWFCDLSQARSLDSLVHAVAQCLEVPLGKADAVQQLGAAIAGRGPCLLILDNFEQVAKHAEATLGQWLGRAAQARFLATSREVLGIAGEQTMALDPLAADEAVALFEQRAAACEGYRPTDEDRRAIPSLVMLMDGLPLAIELAAPRVRVMPPRVLLKRMSERFKLLAAPGGRHDRQATLQATLDWSWDLLSHAERTTLAQLSVFQGGFTLAAADAVVKLSTLTDPPWQTDLLQLLVEKSLVRRVGAKRFTLLLSVKAYAAQHLATPARHAVSQRHWQYFARFDEEAATDDGCADIENLLVACQRSTRQGDAAGAIDCLVLAWAALNMIGPISVAQALAEGVMGMPHLAPMQRAAASRILGNAHYELGHTTQALAQYQSGLVLATSPGPVQARLHCAIAEPLIRSGEAAQARAHLNAALDTGRRTDDPKLRYTALNGLGSLCLDQGQLDEARGHFEQALQIVRSIGQRRWEGGLLGNLGVVAYSAGRLDEAAGLYEQALLLGGRSGDRQWSANARCNLGLLQHERGLHDQAQQQLEAALNTARELGLSRLQCTVLCNLGMLLLARGQARDAQGRLTDALQMAAELGDRRLEDECRRHLGMAVERVGLAQTTAQP